MPNVHLSNLNRDIEINSQESLLEGLKRNGFDIKSSCGGCASCGDCVVVIKEGKDNLTGQTFEEKRLLGNVFHITKERLSCQAKCVGDISIDISNHSQKNLAPEKKPSVIVRKKDTIVKPEVKEKKADMGWYKHWETESLENENTPKKLGGNKRVKSFNFNEDETNEDKE